MQARTQRPHRDWAKSAVECLSVSCGATCQQWPDTGTGALAAAELGVTVCEPHHGAHQADDPQTREQLYQRSFPTVTKILGPTTDFPTWGSSKGTENPKGIWLWRPVGFDYRTSTGLGKQTLWGHKQNLVCTRTQEKGSVTPQETCLWVSRSLGQRCLLTMACCKVRGTECNSAGINPCEGGHHYPYHSLASGQTMGREHSPAHQQKIGIKIYWVWSHPSEKDPHSPKPVPPIRKLPQASYPYPSESRQKEN